MRTPPYPPLDQRRWREPQAHMPVVYAIDLAEPVFRVGQVPVYARTNGIGLDWLFTMAGAWRSEESTQAAVSAIEYLSLFDLAHPSDVLVIDLRITLTAVRRSVAHRSFDGDIFLVDVATLEDISRFYRMAVPYAEEVERDIAGFAAVYNADVEASSDSPGGLHHPDRYLASNWRPTYAYLKPLAKRAIFVHERFKSTIGRRK